MVQHHSSVIVWSQKSRNISNRLAHKQETKKNFLSSDVLKSEKININFFVSSVHVEQLWLKKKSNNTNNNDDDDNDDDDDEEEKDGSSSSSNGGGRNDDDNVDDGDDVDDDGDVDDDKRTEDWRKRQVLCGSSFLPRFVVFVFF